tara:strand:+ start:474 stop:620 length:147 start_codon:yes stop_codon:yes gene_type:complete
MTTESGIQLFVAYLITAVCFWLIGSGGKDDDDDEGGGLMTPAYVPSGS